MPPFISAGSGQITQLSGVNLQLNSGIFSPGMPPTVDDPQRTRSFDFASGYNQQFTPRAYEIYSFAALRAFANVEMVRLAIETRKDQTERFEFRVKKIGARKSDPNDADIKAATKFLRKPDGATDFETWLRAILEDLMAIDAPAIERRFDRAGRLIGLEYVDGATIKILVDSNGRVPMYPDKSYQQVIKGRIWNDLDTQDLIYAPRNKRTNHLYGFGPTEQIIVTVNTLMQRQASQLAYFTASNIPNGILNAPETWSPDQLKSYQDWMDSRLSGNIEERSKVLWVPAGSKYQPFKDSPIKDDFDEWLARIVAYAFNLPPTPFIRQMNRSTGETDQTRALEEGLKPVLNWCVRLFNGIIQDGLGFPDLEFVWETPTDTNAETQSTINDRDVKNGTRTINEVRDSVGLDPYDDPNASLPQAFTASGYVPLDAYARQQANAERSRQDALDAAAIAAEQPVAVQPVAGSQPAKQGNDSGVGKLAQAPFVRSAAGATAPIYPTSRKARRATKRLVRKIETGLSDLADDVGAQLRKLMLGISKAEDAADTTDREIEAAIFVASLGLGLLTSIISDVNAALDDVMKEAVARTIDAMAEIEPDAFVSQAVETSISAALDGLSGSGDFGVPFTVQIGVDVADDLVNRVNEVAVAWARERSAELVGMKYDASGSLVESVDAAMRIDETTRSMLRATIADGLKSNIGLDGIIDSVINSYAFSSKRAELIATTEIANANSQASLLGAKGVESLNSGNPNAKTISKIWLTAGDELVCADVCKQNEEQGPIPLDALFVSGDSAPLAHPKCRCAISYQFANSSSLSRPRNDNANYAAVLRCQ